MKTLLALLLGLALPPAVRAHGACTGPCGRRRPPPCPTSRCPCAVVKADPKKAARTVRVTMSDTMRFDPSQLTLKRGETVTFVVHNTSGSCTSSSSACAPHWKTTRR